MYWLPKLETPTPDLHAANHGLIQVHWGLGPVALMEKWITFACNPQVLASQEIFAITKGWRGWEGGCNRCFTFLVLPFEKGNIFRINVTGLLLQGCG